MNAHPEKLQAIENDDQPDDLKKTGKKKKNRLSQRC